MKIIASYAMSMSKEFSYSILNYLLTLAYFAHISIEFKMFTPLCPMHICFPLFLYVDHVIADVVLSKNNKNVIEIL